MTGTAFADRNLRLEAGSVIPVKLKEAISSDKSHSGDKFITAVQTTDNYSDYGFPNGTRVEGTVQSARPQEGANPGVLDVSFDKLLLPDGRSVRINGSLIGLDNKSVTKSSDGRLIAKNGNKNQRLIYTGYGAAAGLLVGVLTKHTLEDTVIGGGLGYLFGSLQKSHNDPRNVYLKTGTEMGIRLDNRVSLSVDDSESRNSTFRNQTGSKSSTRRRIPAAESDSVDQTDENDSAPVSRQRRTRESDDATSVVSSRTRTSTKSDNSDRSDRSDRSVGSKNGEEIGVLIDDREVRFDSAKPYANEDGIVMVPVIPVLKASRTPYTYDSATKSLSATGSGNRVKITVGSKIAMSGTSKRTRLQATVIRVNGTVYAPLRFLELATGYDTTFDKGSQTVVMTPVEKL